MRELCPHFVLLEDITLSPMFNISAASPRNSDKHIVETVFLII